MAAPQFTLDPRADALGIIDADVLDAALTIPENLGLYGNGIVANDLFARSRFNLLHNVSGAVIALTQPAGPSVDDDTWYDLTTHAYQVYDSATSAWVAMNAQNAREIFATNTRGRIESNRTYAIPTDFATLSDFEDFIRQYTITPGVQITVNVASHTVPRALYGHPQGNQIIYQGAGYTGAVLSAADFVSTGNTAGIIVTDRATNKATVEGRYSTILDFTLGSLGTIYGANKITFKDCLFRGGGANIVFTVALFGFVILGGCSATAVRNLGAVSSGGEIGRIASTGGVGAVVGATQCAFSVTDGSVTSPDTWFFAQCGDGANAAASGAAVGGKGYISLGPCNVLGSLGYGILVQGGGAFLSTALNVTNAWNTGLYGNQGGSMIYVPGGIVRTCAKGGAILNASYLHAANIQFISNTGEGLLAINNSVAQVDGGVFSSNTGLAANIVNGSSLSAATLNVVGNGNTGAVGGMLAQVGGVIQGSNFNVHNNFGFGMQATSGGSIKVDTITVTSNSTDGVQATSGNITLTDPTITNNAARGVASDSGGNVILAGTVTVTGNGSNGINANSGSVVTVIAGATVDPNGATDLTAWIGSTINIPTPAGTPTYSPAVNVIGNFNSYIRS